MEPAILIIDDDSAIRASLDLLLRHNRYRPVAAADPDEALAIVQSRPLDAILMDMNYSRSTSGQEGLELLSRIRALRPALPVLLMTAWASVPLAVEGMKRGANDFISKPWNNEQFLKMLRTALQLSRPVSATGVISRTELDQRFRFDDIIGRSPALLACLQTVAKVGQTDAPVLLTGESGTGKELIAAAIHKNSLRHNHRLVKVNLGAIPATLFES